MKPVGLTMQAFGPYAQKQELDFSELQERTFFLIHGPTGSGKTTILDAMCYALYGDTSGAVRDGKAMRSDHASGDAATQVCFDFAIGHIIYRVERSPEQERPKKNGQGMTKVRPEATLWRIGDAGDEVLAAGWEAVTRYVEKLLGFKSSQFRQVVLLPQGDFRRLLIANSAERQEIMQTLFKTELFQIIEEKLKNKAQALKQQYDLSTQECNWVLKEAAATSTKELSDRLGSDREQVDSVAKQLQAAEHAMKQAQAELAAGQVVQAQFDELATSTEGLAKLTVNIDQISQERGELVRGQQAATLADAERLVISLNNELTKNQQQVVRFEQQLQGAVARQKEARLRLETENNRESVREAALHQIQKLQEIEVKSTQLQQAEEAVKQVKLLVEQANSAKKDTAQMLKNAQEKIAEQNERYHQALRLAAEATGCSLAVEAAEQKNARRRLLDVARKELIAKEIEVSSTQASLRQQDARLAALKQEFVQMQAAWEKEQAAILAAELIEGANCPVCGSLHHPAKATSVGPLPDAQLIKDKQSQVQQVESKREELLQKLSKAEAGQATLIGRIKDFEAELQQMAHAPWTELAQVLQHSREQYQLAIRAKQESDDLALRLEQLGAAQKSALETLEKQEGRHRAAEGNMQAAEAVAADRRDGVPMQYRDILVVKAAQATAAKELKQLRGVFEQAQKESEQANQFVVQVDTTLAASVSALQNIGATLATESSAFSERVANAGFVTLADYQSAKKTQAELKQLEQRIALFDNQLNAARERCDRAQIAVANLTLPDMDSLNHVIQLSMTAYNTALAEHTTLSTRVKQTEDWLRRLFEIERNLQQVEAQYLVYGRLAEVAIGRNEFGLTLQRFVLGALLDDVAIAANERLKTMSRGRYQLQRTMDRARRNSAGGLELEVFDNYTGAARPVTTLSGGETFLASLSLALGLADVVQSYAGGIHLDAIFVDEGFGTLDPETLEFALQALIGLQQGGRLVGIISHVPELKDRIDARLEVTVAAKGSRAAFKVS